MDIRLARGRSDRLWLWVALLALAALAAWGSVYVFGDATRDSAEKQVGANAGFGERRAPLIPAEAEPFQKLTSLQPRDLGRLVRVSGRALSPVRADGLWVLSDDGRRILLRFEPPPPDSALRRLGAGSRVELDGYLGKISYAEFMLWMDSLGVSVPRPPPGEKFGDLPDPSFERVDSLFIKNYYVSVRPEALKAR
jgi:hypothetical protein